MVTATYNLPVDKDDNRAAVDHWLESLAPHYAGGPSGNDWPPPATPC